MADFRHVGREGVRPDAAAKATGRARYIHDLKRPGMLYAAIKRSDQPHARILAIDTTAASRLPGVRAVITAADTPEIRIGFLRDNTVLKGTKVRQYRDEVAAVAATDPDIAREALELIKVRYEPLPGIFSPEEALSSGAPLIHETDSRGKPLSSNLLPLVFHHESGDLDGARRRSSSIASGRYTVPRIQQSCMGTAGCIAEFDLAQNLTIWTKTQIPFLAQRDFNQALAAMGLRGKNCRVIVPTLGGGFGSGLDTHTYEFIAILLSWKAGRPIKMLLNREEEFAFLSPRQSAEVTIEQGCTKEGALTFRKVDVLQDNGAYTSWGATYPGVMMLPATSLYRVEAAWFDARIVYTNNTYCQAMRGYGNPEVTFAVESNLDELAEAAGMDPVEIRLRNCNEPGEVTPMGLKVTTCGLRECLTKTAKRLDWKGKRPRKRGFGIASLVHVGGSGRIYRSDASGVILRLDDYGNVYVLAGGVEMGQGHHTAIRIGVAEYLGVRLDQVFINQTDTATCPWDVGTHASRGAFTALHAIRIASEKILCEMRRRAPEVLPGLIAKQSRELSSLDLARACKDIVVEEGRIAPASLRETPAAWIDLGKFLRSLHFRRGGAMLTAEGFYDPPSELPDWEKGFGNMSACYAYGTQGVEVEVDEETGDVEILKLVAIHDVGKVISPQAAKGQTYGAIAQGIGYALYEEIKSREGRIENPNFTDYKIPTVGELAFPIEIDFVETNEPNGPFGAKGIGEPGLVPTAPAIANAIYDAVGIRIKDLPLTPEKILAALKKPR